MDEPIRIALVDDHRLFRSGIASLIGDFDRYTIIFEAGDGEDGRIKSAAGIGTLVCPK